MRFEQAVRDTFQVVNVTGKEMQAICPWHNDRSGHLYINGITGLYLCFSCGQKGSLETLDLPRIVVGTDDVREKVMRFRAPKQEPKVYGEGWLKQFDVPHPYWTEDRALPKDVVDMFGLGYDPFSNRMTIPLRDLRGRVLGVSYRRLDGGKPKYLDPKSYPKGRHLYGAWLLSGERQVALCEGQVDTIRCWASRVPAVGLMGARITADQIKILQRLNIRTVVLMMDNDNAGLRGTIQIREAMKGSGIRVKVGWYRPYWHGVTDPDGLSPQRLRKMFHSGVSITEWATKVS